MTFEYFCFTERAWGRDWSLSDELSGIELLFFPSRLYGARRPLTDATNQLFSNVLKSIINLSFHGIMNKSVSFLCGSRLSSF